MHEWEIRNFLSTKNNWPLFFGVFFFVCVINHGDYRLWSEPFSIIFVQSKQIEKSRFLERVTWLIQQYRFHFNPPYILSKYLIQPLPQTNIPSNKTLVHCLVSTYMSICFGLWVDEYVLCGLKVGHFTRLIVVLISHFRDMVFIKCTLQMPVVIRCRSSCRVYQCLKVIDPTHPLPPPLKFFPEIIEEHKEAISTI